MVVEKAMAYTVKQVSRISGVSIRTLRFYDETDLLKPAYYGKNGYRFYEEPQLLALQQILFYRELGFELKQIKQTLGRADFEKATALQSHREVLKENLCRARTLMETIDKTVAHLKGAKKMTSEEIFEGFNVGAGQARFDEHVKLGGEPNDCKVSAEDTNGAMCVFEFTGTSCGPRHLHLDQDEWIYVIRGEFVIEVGNHKHHLYAGESIFLPRKVAHGWASIAGEPGRIINVYQPAGKMEDFFREVGKYEGKTPIHDALKADQMYNLFQEHEMQILGPPLTGGWNVDEAGRIVQTS